MGSNGLICKVILRSLTILLTPILFIILPALITLTFPIYLYRVLIAYLAKLFKKELGSIIPCRGNYEKFEKNDKNLIFLCFFCNQGTPLAIDDLYKCPDSTVVISATLESLEEKEREPIDFKSLIVQRFHERIIQIKETSNSEKLLYPEFQQHITQWGGFNFWKWDRNFNAENHVKVYPKIIDNERELLEFEENFLREPYPPGQSPWSICIVNYRGINVKDNTTKCQTILLFQFHHVLADGYAIFNSLMRFFSNDLPIKTKTGNQYTRHVSTVESVDPYKNMNKFVILLRLLFESPYIFAKSVVEMSDWDNDLHPPVSKVTKKVHIGRMEPFPISFIKEIKDSFKVNFNSVLLAGVCGAFRCHLMRKNKNGQCPKEFIHAGIPLPGPSRNSEKLRNAATGGIVRLPVGIDDPIERLKYIDSNMKDMKNSIFPLAAYYMIPVCGAHFSPLLRKALECSTNCIITVAVTIFPGPKYQTQMTFDGFRVSDLRYTSGLYKGNLGSMFTILSYNGFVRICSEIDTGLKDSNFNMDTMIQDFKNELFILKTKSFA